MFECTWKQNASEKVRNAFAVHDSWMLEGFGCVPRDGDGDSVMGEAGRFGGALGALGAAADGRGRLARKVVMDAQEMLPRYDAWVPVRSSHWSESSRTMLEPYIPYFGDDKAGVDKAFQLYNRMRAHSSATEALSDGEVDADGNLQDPENDMGARYDEMCMVRRRAGCRAAILAIVAKFGDEKAVVWEALSTALDMAPVERVKAVCKVAEDREVEASVKVAKLKHRRKLIHSVREALNVPVEDKRVVDASYSAATCALDHFCFTCFVFACSQHQGTHVQPVIPIKDSTTEQRMADIQKGKVKPCSSRCAFQLEWEKAPFETQELEPWTPEQLSLLREGAMMFKKDPCGLAIVIGSRSCREVHSKLQEPAEAALVRRLITSATTKNRNPTRHNALPLAPGQEKNGKAESDESENGEAETGEMEFVPCLHAGECTAENDKCICVQNQLRCESTCGCNSGRYGEAKCGGIAWGPPTNQTLPRRCINKRVGCECREGFCNTDACLCWAEQRACNPDWCNSCDCNIIPSNGPFDQRRCRNADVSIAKHKRTFVGKSPVHGFGLFAGDTFEKGELIGLYTGLMFDSATADRVGLMYEATDHTFLFDKTRDLVIDGGLLGSKIKFCNHTKKSSGLENCESRFARVRGEGHVALVASKRVGPGDEFLFGMSKNSSLTLAPALERHLYAIHSNH